MEKKKTADQTPNNDKKQALDTAIRQIEKNFGKGAVMRLGDRPDLQVDAIPTGSLALDAALGIGGVPKGRIIEIYGPESSGKTTLALHIVAQAQKRGGEVAFVDAEHALDPDYACLLYTSVVPIGEILECFENGDETYQDEQIVNIAGIVEAIKMKTTRSGSMMAYVTVEDDTGSMELLTFSTILNQYGSLLYENAAVRCV